MSERTEPVQARRAVPPPRLRCRDPHDETEADREREAQERERYAEAARDE